MEDDFFDDNLSDDYDNREKKQLIERFDKMIETNKQVYFDSDDYAIAFDHYFYTGKTNKAKTVLQLGLKLFPNSLHLQLKKVSYLIYSQKTGEALNLLLETDKALFSDPDIQLEQAHLYVRLKRLDNAIKKYQELLNFNDEYVDYKEDAYMGLAEIYERMGNKRKALNYLKKALDLNNDNELLLLNILNLYYDTESGSDNYEIIDFFVDYLNKNPFSSMAWCYLGIEYTQNNLLEKAIEAFNYSLAIDEKAEESLVYLMSIYFNTNEYDKANEIFESLIKVTDFKEIAWQQLAESLFGIKNYESALMAYQKSIDINPDFIPSYTGMAMTYAAIKQYNKAIENIKKAVELDVEDADAWFLLADYLMESDKQNEAEIIYQHIAERFPKEHYTWLDYSNFYLSNDDVNQAINVLVYGIEFQQDNISYIYRLANYHFIKEDNLIALSFLQMAYLSNSDLLHEFFEYDDSMYNIPEVIDFLEKIKSDA